MIEMWGGLECTVVRIGDTFRDQTGETGHAGRIEDLDLIADLGISTLRYPVLWETISPDDPARADFTWHDERLERLKALGVRAIAGLCHHGSGPRYTHLLDPDWPTLLAAHALRVAERYPHLELYTPVNEPLTTARFAALYGHWYPHERSYRAFLRALVTECKATVLAMRAIRTVRPDARLVQTDDLGKTFSTPLLAYQAAHENSRRWLTFDLLCGMVDRNHEWWRILVDHGIGEEELEFFLPGDAAPDIIGVNHYLTSERYLDERVERYPENLRGGNHTHRYADAEAVRMPIPHTDLGPAARLREVWERYRRPVAVTEVHHGCSRDDQLRWLVEVWNAAETVRAEGADIRAITAWSILGAVDWNSLLTRRDGFYEPGLFDVRGQAPRRTALAHATEGLARTGSYDHPVLDRAGWWKRADRFYRRPRDHRSACRLVGSPRQLLVTGATGTLGRAFSRICDARGLEHMLTSRAELDIADRARVRAALARARPWAVVNTAGFVRVAEAETARDACFRENVDGAAMLAEACAELGIPYVTFSSDLVFDGHKGGAYVETDPVNPTTVYGASKAEAERRVLAAHPGALVVRASAFFGPWDRYNFVWAALNTLDRRRRFEAGADVVSPTYVPDLVHETLNLLIDDASGVWHLATPGSLSWAELARRAARLAGLDPDLVVEAELGGAPADTTLTSARGVLMPGLDGALERYMRECETPWRAAQLRVAAS
ncbi:sugar nucleotide-binding protein [Alsobacter sp. SYSU M60028]|uniref:dTDP-4-dehydrorhamnose reductase n=1 Tax=Alsobacter ponti TaxID=2962936 RepID=A0ABT1L6B7_9HYPH|nr:family 1 glycosylhydrolase [Alsobacter ponti]MCP8936940.1 sugar nucleotide-binding protein [Alsobacter ponti]